MTTLTVLGCGTPYPRPGDPCSGYLVQAGETSLWIDCGPGTFTALQHHIQLSDLSVLWISHLHPDHSADLLSVFNWLANTPSMRRLITFGPPGWANRLAAMLPMPDAESAVQQLFEVRELSNGHVAEIPAMKLVASAMDHSVPTFGLRLETTGATIAYSADTSPCPALTALAADADLFICEAGAEQAQHGHCTAEQAGRVARKARSRRQLIVHVPAVDGRRTAAETAAKNAGCPVDAGRPGMRISLAERPSGETGP